MVLGKTNVHKKIEIIGRSGGSDLAKEKRKKLKETFNLAQG